MTKKRNEESLTDHPSMMPMDEAIAMAREATAAQNEALRNAGFQQREPAPDQGARTATVANPARPATPTSTNG